jgi:lysozyme
MTDFRPDPPKTRNAKGPAAAVMAAAILIATPVITHFEGERRVGYRDLVGIATSCIGHTGPDAVVGRRYTAEECQGQLARDVRAHAEKVADCIKVPVSAKTEAAFISFAFNVGTGAFCKASLTKKLNRGDYAGACNGLLAWDYAGGKRVPGLTKRRQDERALCLDGLG